jgi:uncharacterized membrane protein
MRWFSVKPTLVLKGRKFKGLRGWSGKPFHPPLTDVPIGAYVLVAIFDLISVWKGDSATGRDYFVAGTFVIVAGAIVSLATALTGFVDWLRSAPKGTQAWRTANTHMAIMLTVTALVLVNIIWRVGDWDTNASTPTGVMILSLVIGGLVSLGATYGGTMVYDYEFNVEQDKGYAWERTERDYTSAEEAESTGKHA